MDIDGGYETEDIIPYNNFEAAVSKLSKNVTRLVRLPSSIHTFQLVVLNGLKIGEFLSNVLVKCS